MEEVEIESEDPHTDNNFKILNNTETLPTYLGPISDLSGDNSTSH